MSSNEKVSIHCNKKFVYSTIQHKPNVLSKVVEEIPNTYGSPERFPSCVNYED